MMYAWCVNDVCVEQVPGDPAFSFVQVEWSSDSNGVQLLPMLSHPHPTGYAQHVGVATAVTGVAVTAAVVTAGVATVTVAAAGVAAVTGVAAVAAAVAAGVAAVTGVVTAAGVATAGVADVHVPPPTVELNVVLPAIHASVVPLNVPASGAVFIVTVLVSVASGQPVPVTV